MLKHFEPFYFGDESRIVNKEDILNILGAEESGVHAARDYFIYIDASNMRHVKIKTWTSKYALVSPTISVEISEMVLENPEENKYGINSIWRVDAYHFADAPNVIPEGEPKKDSDLFEKEKNRIMAELHKIMERK